VLLASILADDNESHGLASITTEEDAADLVRRLLAHPTPRLLVRVDKTRGSDGEPLRRGGRFVLAPTRGAAALTFDPEARYAWLYSGPPSRWASWAGPGLVLTVLAVVLFPVWPTALKIGVWYVAVTLLLALLGLLFVRYSLALVAWVAGWELWLFPRLFDDTAGFRDSFRPVVSAARAPSAGAHPWLRVGMLLALVAFVAWASQAPQEVEAFVATQRQLVDDLYSGALLADVSATAEETAAARERKGSGAFAARRDRQRLQPLSEVLADLDERDRAGPADGGAHTTVEGEAAPTEAPAGAAGVAETPEAGAGDSETVAEEKDKAEDKDESEL
jgi:translocation protein SEC62